MLLILLLTIIALQVGAYKLANKVKMKHGYLKVLIVFLVFDFSAFPYLMYVSAPGRQKPEFEMTDSNFLMKTWIIGAVMILITHLICFMNHKTKLRKMNSTNPE